MTTSAEALVTVVVACYNHRDYVEQALRSVFAQTLPRVDVIVTDDASKDDSQSVIDELVESHGWQAKRIYHSQNRGVCATFNEALSAVGTPFVAFISADDWMHPTRLERQLAKFAETPSDTALVHTDATMVDESGAELGHLWSDARAVPASTLAGGSPDAQSIFLWNYIAAPTVLLRAAAVRDVGGYDESLAFEDLDMWVRLALRYRFSYIPEPLTSYRRVANSLGGQINKSATLARGKLHVLSKLMGHSRELDDWALETRYVVAKSAAQSNLLSVGEAARSMWPYALRAKRPGPFYHLARNALRVLPLPRSRAASDDGEEFDTRDKQ